MSASADSMKKSFQSISKNSLNRNNDNNNAASSMEMSQTCSVCAEIEPKYWSVSPCSHKICWICSLRLRALYNSKACPICKTQSEVVYVCKRVEEAEAFFANRASKKGPPVNEGIAMVYENEVIRAACESLLQLQCPFNHNMSSGPNSPAKNGSKALPACTKHFKTKHELRKHVQNAHELQMCEICLDHKKCFSVELSLFNRTSLQKHQRDANHPRCQVCDRMFYSEDELNEHCRDEHELCHICQRTGRPNRYFQNYTRLEEHFGREHFLCPEPLCRELKFVVFENELEYKAHQAEVHLAHQKLQRSQQRQLQRLNITFDPAGTVETSSTANNTPSPLKLTADQRNQIGANLVYGEVTDDLANRMQSLSLYQNRNDEFVESLRGTFHLSQMQIQAIFEAARNYQKTPSGSATEFILKLEKILGGGNCVREVIKIAGQLSELQLDEMKRHKIDFALQEYQEKCSAFPELGGGRSSFGGSMGNRSTIMGASTTGTTSTTTVKKGPSWVAPMTSKSKTKFVDDQGGDPFGFARSKPPGFTSTISGNNSTVIPAASERVKVLQIVKPASQPTGPLPKTADPSKNPALLLSHLAGGPVLKGGKSKKTATQAPVKITSFSSAALGTTTPVSTRNKTEKLNEQEFPSLSSPTKTATASTSTASVFTSSSNNAQGNAFFAPSDRDQLESFTIGTDETTEEDEKAPVPPSNSNTGKKAKKVVFRYGQKWDI